MGNHCKQAAYVCIMRILRERGMREERDSLTSHFKDHSLTNQGFIVHVRIVGYTADILSWES